MDIADQKGLGQIALPVVGWGTEFADFDGDGWLDLVVANGSTLEDDGSASQKTQAAGHVAFLEPARRILPQPRPVDTSV